MKVKAAVLIILTLAAQSFAQAGKHESPVKGSVRFDDLRRQYRSFAEIKPKVLNASGRSIYLKWTHPHGAHLKRLNEQTGEWEAGGRGINCGTGLGGPIEIKAGESKAVATEWWASTDDFESPKFFELEDHKTLRPLSGRYKLYIPYAVEVWALGRSPVRIYYLESPEFTVAW